MTKRALTVLITTGIPKARGPKARSPIRAPSILVDPKRLTRSLLKSAKWRVSHTGVSVCGPLWPLFVHLFAHLWVRRPHFSCLSFNPPPLMQAAERKIFHSAPTPSPILFWKKKKTFNFYSCFTFVYRAGFDLAFVLGLKPNYCATAKLNSEHSAVCIKTNMVGFLTPRRKRYTCTYTYRS